MEDCNIPSSTQSKFHERGRELYPKQKIIKDYKYLSVSFSILCGESVQFLGCTVDGIVALSNYRLYLQLTGSKDYRSIPLGLIESFQIKDVINMEINCKDAKVFRWTFITSEQCYEWFRRLTKETSSSKTTGSDFVFAFALYAWVSEEGGEELLNIVSKKTTATKTEAFYTELERLNFDISEGGPWRVSTVNEDGSFCLTYPQNLLVPAIITDEDLKAASTFRIAHRLPTVVWRNKRNGAVIARCSQPQVGITFRRSNPDENLIKAIQKACWPYAPECNIQMNQRILIIDARSYVSAFANQARGGGFERPEYYPNCEVQWMDLPNIHSIRQSFIALRSLCSEPSYDQNWFSMLEASRWLHNMAALMQTAATAATTIENEGRPVLVHCSDGWDRTPQIVSIAEIMLDPYYRTIEGFQILVEREWLEFGHKFADRCGQTEDLNKYCPVFLQFLDILHNIIKQFPTAFEFSINYLVEIAHHTYSDLFGTFLCNSSKERSNFGIQHQTFSIWNFLQGGPYVNHLYACYDKVLYPMCNVCDLQVWRELYLQTNNNPDIDLLNIFTARPSASGSADVPVTSVTMFTEASTSTNVPPVHPSSVLPGQQKPSDEPNIPEVSGSISRKISCGSLPKDSWEIVDELNCQLSDSTCSSIEEITGPSSSIDPSSSIEVNVTPSSIRASSLINKDFYGELSEGSSDNEPVEKDFCDELLVDPSIDFFKETSILEDSCENFPVEELSIDTHSSTEIVRETSRNSPDNSVNLESSSSELNLFGEGLCDEEHFSVPLNKPNNLPM